MKVKPAILAFTVLLTGLLSSPAMATENPVVESFTFTPTEIDLLDADIKLSFELIVSHPFGIENPSSFITIRDSVGSTWGTPIFRTDLPANLSQKKVTYKGVLALPRTISPGVYTLSASEVRNNKIAGYSYSTGEIFTKKIRDLPDAENSLLIKSAGDLNYLYKTFQGPSYDSSLSINFKDTNKYNSSNKPIWKVGETFSPLDFYELKVSSLELQIKSNSPSTCSSDGKILKLNSVGNCDYTVFTSKTKDFSIYEDKQTVQITNSRIKSTLFIPQIENQTAKNLPKIINLPQVYSAAEGYVLAKTITPLICVPSGFTVRLLSGGVCTLTYETAATATYLASDVYKQTFEILRDPQLISFTLPKTADVSSKSLALNSTASGGGAVTYSTTSPDNCSISGSTLNLLKAGNCVITASQSGTSTLAPVTVSATIVLTGSVVTPKPVVTKKTIVCVKGKTTKKVSGANPKCPKGYKVKK
jgi:hypothetical protein